MRRIAYYAPDNVDDAIAILSAHGVGARVLAGGTDLIVQVREALRECDVIVDGKRIPELSSLRLDEQGRLSIGAAVPCYRIYETAAVARGYGALVDAVRIIGGIAIQSRASVGGNLCNAGPAADGIPALIVHRATCVIAGPNGNREIPVEDFCVGPGRTVLRHGELLLGLRLPPPRATSGSAYIRFTPRAEMDIAVAGAAAAVSFDGDTVVDAWVAIGAVAPTPLLIRDAGIALVGSPGDAPSFDRAAGLAQAASRPISDMRGTAEHRRHLVGILVRRALDVAATRAKTARGGAPR
jgi:CO/xanthine dehydrogenase FAD-binding subunit